MILLCTAQSALDYYFLERFGLSFPEQVVFARKARLVPDR